MIWYLSLSHHQIYNNLLLESTIPSCNGKKLIDLTLNKLFSCSWILLSFWNLFNETIPLHRGNILTHLLNEYSAIRSFELLSDSFGNIFQENLLFILTSTI